MEHGEGNLEHRINCGLTNPDTDEQTEVYIF
jgi:hypothetical protein